MKKKEKKMKESKLFLQSALCAAAENKTNDRVDDVIKNKTNKKQKLVIAIRIALVLCLY
jgi:hypothetical protein